MMYGIVYAKLSVSMWYKIDILSILEVYLSYRYIKVISILLFCFPKNKKNPGIVLEMATGVLSCKQRK